jgi:hypothetical protein
VRAGSNRPSEILSLAQVGQLKNMFDQFSLEVGDCGTGHELLFESAV